MVEWLKPEGYLELPFHKVSHEEPLGDGPTFAPARARCLLALDLRPTDLFEIERTATYVRITSTVLVTDGRPPRAPLQTL